MSTESVPALPAESLIAEPTLREEALRFTRELIRIDSVNPPAQQEGRGDGESRAVALIDGWLREAGWEPRIEEPVPGRASLVARLRGRDRRAGALVVHAHVDVVPVGGQEWERPPFGAEIHDGVLYGRGAVDMKNYAGTLVAVARWLTRHGIVPERDLIFAFFADEEAGGYDGARWLVRHRPELFAGATEALGEVGGFSLTLPEGLAKNSGVKRVYPVATAEKGSTTALLTARGRAGHASSPTEDNATVALAEAVARVGRHVFPVQLIPAARAFLDGLGLSAGQSDSGALPTAELQRLLSPALRNTATPTVLTAGTRGNVIPALAQATLDVRLLPGAEQGFAAELQQVAGPDVEVRLLEGTRAIDAPLGTPLLAGIQSALDEDDPQGLALPYLLPASTDNKHLAELGIRGYGFVPLRVPEGFDAFGQFHTADERVPVESLAFGARVTARLLAGQ